MRCSHRPKRATTSSWRTVVANAHSGMMPRCACSASPATPSSSTPPGRLEAAASLPHRNARAHCPIHSMLPAPDTPRDATRRRGPEETLGTPGLPHLGFDSPKHALQWRTAARWVARLRRLRIKDDPLAQGRPFADLFNEHDDVKQGFNPLFSGDTASYPSSVTARKEASTCASRPLMACERAARCPLAKRGLVPQRSPTKWLPMSRAASVVRQPHCRALFGTRLTPV